MWHSSNGPMPGTCGIAPSSPCATTKSPLTWFVRLDLGCALHVIILQSGAGAPLAKVATEAQALRDLERRDNAAFNALTGLIGRLGCDPIFSTRLVEMSSEAISFDQHRL
jgi:hypothetical protein